jgi:hypothetical protein
MRNIVLATIIIASVVAGLAMPALADDVAQCKQLGYKPGTALFLQCLTLYQRQRTQEEAQAPAAGVAEQAPAKAQTGAPITVTTAARIARNVPTMCGHRERRQRGMFTQPVLALISPRLGFAKAFVQVIIG